jgi:DNA polymerase III epsilon subunit-like protein
MLRKSNLLFFDCECSGLDAMQYDIIEVGCILTDSSGLMLLSDYETKITPTRPVDAEAARVNGYDYQRWRVEAVPLERAIDHVLAMGRGATFVAHNAAFDWGFLQSAVDRCKKRWICSYRLDTITLAMPLLQAGKVSDLKLSTLVRYFGIEQKNSHSAMSDVYACREVYLRLMKLYSKALDAGEPEEIVRPADMLVRR